MRVLVTTLHIWNVIQYIVLTDFIFHSYLFVIIVFFFRLTHLITSIIPFNHLDHKSISPTFGNLLFGCTLLHTCAAYHVALNVYMHIFLCFVGHNEEWILLMYLRGQNANEFYVLFILSALLDVQITWFYSFFPYSVIMLSYFLQIIWFLINMGCLVLAILKPGRLNHNSAPMLLVWTIHSSLLVF